jgi:GT2 family glycosyltransferase
MKVAVLMLSYNRYELLTKTLPHNIKNARYPFDLYVWDNGSTDPRVMDFLKVQQWYMLTEPSDGINRGIAQPFNHLMDMAFRSGGYDAVVFMANDIKEPKNWLAERVKYLKAIPNSGMVSVACSKHDYRPKSINGLMLYPGHVIGQFMISRQVFDKVGYFREDFGHYGPIDNDYNVRCDRLGFTSYYLPDLKAIHLDDKDDQKYGYSKKEKVKETWQQFTQDVQRYADPTACYIPYNGQTTINMNDHVR